MKQENTRLPSLLQVIISLGLFLLLAFSFTAKLDLPIQLALYIGWFIIMVLGIRLGHSYKTLETAALNGISNGLGAVLILLAVGALVGTWISGGIVPTIIYYGLQAIHPSIFLFSHYDHLFTHRTGNRHFLGRRRYRRHRDDGYWPRPWRTGADHGWRSIIRLLLWRQNVTVV